MCTISKQITIISIISIIVLTSCATDTQTSTASDTDTAKIYNLRLAMSWPSTLPILSDAAKRLAQNAYELSNGRLVIEVDGSEKHRAPLDIFDFVEKGIYDLGHTTSYFYKGKVPEALYFTTMPFGMTTSEQWAWFEHGGGNELMQQVYNPYNITPFIAGNTTNQMGGWFLKEINSVKDLQGLKMRIPGFAGEVLASIGAKPTNIPPGELYTSLERGTIDALEWVGPYLDLQMGFADIAPYYYSGWHEPAAEVMVMANTKVYEELPTDLQSILRGAIKEAAFNMFTESTHYNAQALAEIKTSYPQVSLKVFPQEVMQALKQANAILLEQKSQESELAAKIIASQQEYMKKARQWSKISDQLYLNTIR